MRDDELKRLIRRDMEKELAFLNDRPSLRGQIMQRMKGARVVKRRISLSLAVVLALLLSTAAALAAGGWNVLDFLGLTDENEAAVLVTPVAAEARTSSCVMRIDSAMADSFALAFDWTVENLTPDVPFVIQVEKFTGNGISLATDGNDDFNQQWFPGMYNDGRMQDGNMAMLPAAVTGDTLEVEMAVGVYTPEKPVYQMSPFSADEAQKKLDEGFYVIADGEGYLINDPEDGLCVVYGGVNETTGKDLRREEMTLRFTVDLAVARAATRSLPLPEPMKQGGFTLQYTAATVTPLQTILTLNVISDKAAADELYAIVTKGGWTLHDSDGEPLEHRPLFFDLSADDVFQMEDGRWCLPVTYAFANDDTLPDVVGIACCEPDSRKSFFAPIRIR